MNAMRLARCSMPQEGNRDVTLKVIGAGFGRTGTWSTYAALNHLGFRCYHMAEALSKENKTHLDFWRKVANSPPGSEHDWSQVYSKYNATVDNPGCCVWRELMQAYPDAKVILTLHPRGPEAWYESAVDTIYYYTEIMWQFKVLELLTPFGRKFGDTAHKLIWGRTLKGVMDDRTKAVARYKAYVDEVKAAVPANKLLIFSVDQGWEPLCAFLRVSQPDAEFPNLNDRAAIRRMIRGMAKRAHVILAGIGTAAMLMLGCVYWFLR